MSKKSALILILAVSALLSLSGLSRGDTVNDEVFMSFRGIGLMDFDEAEAQTTPWEWFDPDIPFWAKISFHDHPLLVPTVQNIFMKIFGESNFGFRLPSALLGIVSVYLVYLIGRRLYSDSVGLISAALFGVTLNHIYISRVGMQEAYVIFFLLLISYWFLKSLQNDKYLIWVGAAIGFGLLAKYTVGIILPILLTYLLIFRRDYFKNKRFWLGALAAAVIFSPVIIYNIGLYRAVGHFDFQFSHIFGQHPEVWQVAPGKEIGTMWDRLRNFIPRMMATNSWVFLALIDVSVLSFIFAIIRRGREAFRAHSFLVISLLYLVILLLIIGPSYRFLTMLTPFLALAIGAALGGIYQIFQKQKNILYFLFLIIIFFEIGYSINNQIVYYPWPQASASWQISPWLVSKVRYENYNWGYNQLGEFLEKELSGKMPAITFDLRYQFLEKFLEQALARGQVKESELYPALIIYDGNFDKAAKLWVLDRRHIYHAWPIISSETYLSQTRELGADYYDRVGFQVFYYIVANNTVSSPEFRSAIRGVPIGITNPRGEEVFQIYKFVK